MSEAQGAADAGGVSFASKVDAMVGRLETDNYYELLEVPRYSGGKPIEEAWARLSRQFDPDGPEAAEAVEHQAELQAVVTVLREAYEVLSDPATRARYDAHLDREPRGVSFPMRRDTPAEQTPAPAPKREGQRSDRNVERERKRRARKNVAQRLASLGSSEARDRTSRVRQRAPARQEAVEGLRRTLAQGAERRSRLSGSIERADGAPDLDKGREPAPDSDEHLEQLVEEARKKGRLDLVAKIYGRLSDRHRADAGKARRAAVAFLEAGEDMRLAQLYAKRSVELAPDSTTNLRIMGRIFIESGNGASARQVLEDVLGRDPHDEKAQKLLELAQNVDFHADEG